MIRRLCLLLAVVALAAAHPGHDHDHMHDPSIYPHDHWSYSTKLTKQNFDSVIQEAIDAGKTMFVRWIASDG